MTARRIRGNPPVAIDLFRDSGKPKLLDLFCCAGGAGVGYKRAGFDVVGVDISPQPNYPLTFLQADALGLDPEFLKSFDVIHASPPCQSYSDLAKRNGNGHEWPRLIEPVRKMLQATRLPYVIENVQGAPLIDPVILCGTMFPKLRVIRHRLFESNVQLVAPEHRPHPLVFTHDKRKAHYGKLDQDTAFVQVTGGGNCSIANAREAMGISWMTKGEINESIPPAYTQYLGKQLISYLKRSEDVTTIRRKRA
jgi:DNA (cytosine-5)-methyltransferase 1